MIEAIKHITEALKLPEIVAEINDRAFLVIAEPGTAKPFINFSIREVESASKNGIYEYSTEISIYGKRLTEVSSIAETVRDTIKRSSYRWKYRGMGSPGFADPEAKEAYITITFEFKL